MPSIDERVVSMAFENTVFESRVSQTMSTLAKLDTAIKNIGGASGFSKIEAESHKVTLTAPMSALEKLKSKLGLVGDGAAQGFSEIDRAGNKVTLDGPARAVDKLQGKLGNLNAGSTFADIEGASNRVSLGGLHHAIDSVSAKFSTLQTAAAVALGGIGTMAATAGAGLVKKMTLGPAIEGFRDYELKVGSVQTIMSSTGEKIGPVTKQFKEMDTYADRTIYSLRDMTGNIGKFTNAGVKLPVAVDAMKGIANVAALSGASSQEASRAMYNLGQAIGSGTVRLMDWRSVELANMGTKEFKQELINSALAMGKLEKGSDGLIRTSKGTIVNFKTFGTTLQDQWLTSEALTKTLNKYSDETTALGKKAYGAATDVKTFSMMLETLGAAAGTGWTDTFEIILGNLPEATKLWTDISNVIGGFIGKTADARNEMLETWKELGGREDLFEGIKNVFDAIFGVLKPIGQAFRDIFPKKTGEDLATMSENFRKFTETLKPSPELVDQLRRIFSGLFAVLEIGWTVFKEVVGVIADLFGVVGNNSGGFLNFIASIGDFLVAVDTAVTKGGALKGIFKTLGAVLAVPLEIIKAIADALFGMFDGADPKKAEGVAGTMSDLDKALRPLRGILDKVREGWEKFLDIIQKVRDFLEPGFTKAMDFIGDLGNTIADKITEINWETALNALQTGLIGGIFLKLKQALGGGISDIGGGILDNINGILGGVTKNLEAMQDTLRAATLLQIAAAIGILAVALLILSTIDGDDLNRSMGAVAIGMGQLIAALAILSKMKTGFVQLPIIAGSMILLATAVVILAGAMKIMSTMSWEEIAKGLVGVGGAIAVVGGATQLLSGPKLIVAAAALIPLAIGMIILAAAVKMFATMSWEELGKGLVGVAGSLLMIALALAVMPPNMIVTGAGLVLVAFGLTMLAGAVTAFGSLDIKTMVQGLFGIGAAIMIIAGAMMLMPPTLPLIAAGLILVSIALTAIAGAIAILGNMDVGTLVKGLIAMGGALLILSVGLTLMAGTLPGSVALLAAALAFAVLGPALAFLGTLAWGTIFKGLLAIALVLGTIAIVGLVAAPALIAIGAALAVLGLGLLVVAGAAYLFGKAFQLVGAEGTKAFSTLIAAIGAFIVVFPKMVIDFVKGLVTILQEIVKLVPTIVTALVSIVTTLLDAIIKLAPKLAEAIGAIVSNLLTILQQNAPKLIQAGATLFLSLLRGIRDNMPKIAMTVVDIILRFLNTLATQIPRLIEGGAKALIKFLEGMIAQIPRIVPIVARMINTFLNNVTARIPEIVKSGVNLIVKFINAIANHVGELVEAGTNFILKFLDGIQKAIPRIARKGLAVAKTFLNNLADGMVKLADMGFDALIEFLNGLEKSIRENMPELIQAGLDIADALIDGVADGFGFASGPLKKALDKIFGLLPGWAKKILGISSPSTVFSEIGGQTLMGFAKGVDDNHRPVQAAGEGMANSIIGTVKNTLKIRSPSEVMQNLGKAVGQGFAQGVHGSASDIRSAFGSLRDQLKNDIKTTGDQIKADKKQLEEELAKKPSEQDPKLIKELQTAIRQNTSDLKKMSEARRVLNIGLKEEKKELIGLSKEYEKTSKKLDDAKQALDEATRARDEAQKSYTDQYSQLPDIDKLMQDALADAELTEQQRQEKIDKIRQEAEKRRQINQVENYKKALQAQIEATKKYNETLQKLRALGLDDATYKKLLAKGIEGQEFADQLLQAGKPAIDEINRLDAELLANAANLAKEAAANLYQAGVDAAQGLVDGLKAKKAQLADAMDDLADMMVRSIKRQLKIKSPSEVFAEVGKFISQGLARGLDSSEATVAAAQLGKDTLSAISGAITDNIDVDPVISPVLDLTNVRKEAKNLENLTNVTPITAAASFGQARAISTEKQAVEVASDGQVVQAGTTFNYEQNNYSPEKLSDVEIYRQTKNQLSQVKSALGLTS